MAAVVVPAVVVVVPVGVTVSVAVVVVVARPAAGHGTGGFGLRARSVGRPLALGGARFTDLGVPDEVLVEHHGGEVVLRASAVVVGLPVVRERLAPHVVRHRNSLDLGGLLGQGVRRNPATPRSGLDYRT